MSKIRIACVGDSITYGYCSSNPETESYPAQLKKMLGDGYTVGNFGINSATTLKSGNFPYVKTEQYRDSLDFLPEMVIFMLGTNDSKPINWESNRDNYKKDAMELLDQYKNLSSRPVIFMATSPTAWYNEEEVVNSGTITPETVETIAELQREIIRELDLNEIDINQLTKDKREYFPDGVHPNDEGYSLLAGFFYDYIIQYGG